MRNSNIYLNGCKKSEDLHQQPNCWNPAPTLIQDMRLELTHLQGMFYIWFVGVALSAVLFFIEKNLGLEIIIIMRLQK